MRPSLALLWALLKADLRKAHLASVSGHAPVGAVVGLLALGGFGAGFMPALVLAMFRSVNPLVFDFYLLTVFSACVLLFPTGLFPDEERDFIDFLRFRAPLRRSLESLRVISFGLPVTTASAAPTLAASCIFGASLADICLLYLLMVTSGLTVMLAVETIHKLRLIRRQGWESWMLNLSFAVFLGLAMSALLRALSQDAREPGMALGPGAALSWVFRCATGNLFLTVLAALASVLLVFSAAALLSRAAGGRHNSELGCLFAAEQSMASRCVQACNARAGNRSWLGFVSSVLVLYMLRARRLNALLMISLVLGFFMSIGPGATLKDESVPLGMPWIVFSLSAFFYSSFGFSQDSHQRIPVYLHGMKLHRLAFATMVFSSLVSASIVAAPLPFLLLRGRPSSAVLESAAWVLLAAYVSHLVMALIRPQLPLNDPIGTFATILTLVRCILVCWIVSLGSSLLLFRLPEPFRTGWSMIGIYAATAIPLTFAVVRILPRRLRYLIPAGGILGDYRPISEFASDHGSRDGQR